MINEITHLFKHIQDGVNGLHVKSHVELELNKGLDNVRVGDNVQVLLQKHKPVLLVFHVHVSKMYTKNI